MTSRPPMPRPSTEDLIRDLASRPPPAPFPALGAVAAMVAAVAAGVALFWLAFGLRPDMAEAAPLPMTWVKSALPLALALLAMPLAIASARPGARLRLWPLALLAAVGLALFLQRLWTVPQGQLLPELVGQTAAACLLSVTALSAIPVTLGLLLLRRGAPTRPALTGACLGIATAAAVTSGYALHCTEDSPLFFVLWYGLAIAITGGLAALAGRRLLRW